MKKIIIGLVVLSLVLVIGCSKQTEEEKNAICKEDCLSNGWQYGKWVGYAFCNCYNDTLIINNPIQPIEYRNITITGKCNLTYSDDKLELIRRLKFLEDQQDKLIMNETRCIGNNSRCEDKIDMYIRDIDELEDDLYNCTRELCDLNNTWC